MERFLQAPLSPTPPLSLETLLWIACTKGDLEAVLPLLSLAHVDVNWSDSGSKRSPLYRAAGHGHAHVVERLLGDKRVDVNQEQYQGATPFFIAAQEGHVEVLRLLLADPRVDVNLPRYGGFTPFHVACEWNRVELVAEMMKDKRIDLVRSNDEGITPLMAACCRGNAEVVKVLLLGSEQMAETLNFARRDGATPFFLAVQNNHVDVVEMLLQDQRLQADKPKADGITPLWIACHNGSQEIVEMILAYAHVELDLEARWKVSKLTALQESFSKNFPKIEALLVSFMKDRKATRQRLRTARGITEKEASDLFALTVLLSDSHLVLHHQERNEKAVNFFRILEKLPIELQMVLCNRAAGSPKDIILTKHSEPSFRKLLQLYETHAL